MDSAEGRSFTKKRSSRIYPEDRGFRYVVGTPKSVAPLALIFQVIADIASPPRCRLGSDSIKHGALPSLRSEATFSD